MKILKYKLTGSCPLMMHADTTVNPFHAITKEIKKLTSKRSKTEEDMLEIMKLEWRASLYFNERLGYYIPSNNIFATLWNAAKTKKFGVKFKQGIVITEDSKMIFTDSNLTPSQLFLKSEYQDIRSVVINRARICKCRPIFPEWTINVSLMVDESIIDEDQLDEILNIGGNYIGVCDYRPKFGRFNVEKIIL